jgi:hypothetical protein
MLQPMIICEEYPHQLLKSCLNTVFKEKQEVAERPGRSVSCHPQFRRASDNPMCH